MNTKELLTKAKELISDPNKWTKESFARNKDNKPVEYLSPDATCFCAIGAIRKVGYSNESFTKTLPAEIKLQREVQKNTIFAEVASFNDFLLTTHEEVLHLFDKAIEAAE